MKANVVFVRLRKGGKQKINIQEKYLVIDWFLIASVFGLIGLNG
jgi:hypothetical protein